MLRLQRAVADNVLFQAGRCREARVLVVSLRR